MLDSVPLRGLSSSSVSAEIFAPALHFSNNVHQSHSYCCVSNAVQQK